MKYLITRIFSDAILTFLINYVCESLNNYFFLHSTECRMIHAAGTTLGFVDDYTGPCTRQNIYKFKKKSY